MLMNQNGRINEGFCETYQANGPDEIPSLLLKENADILADLA